MGPLEMGETLLPKNCGRLFPIQILQKIPEIKRVMMLDTKYGKISRTLQEGNVKLYVLKVCFLTKADVDKPF